jgi:hypothetical protein
MGVLGVNGSGNGDQHIDPPEAETPAEPAAEGQPRDDAGQFVPAAALVPETQDSRRKRIWQERVAEATKPIEERFTKELSARDEQLAEERRQRSEQAQTLARLQGQIEAMQRQPVAQAPQQAQGPDPTELRRKAREALQGGNIDEYERLRDEAAEIIADRKAEARVKALQQEMQRSQATQLPPHIQGLLMQHPTVANAGPKGAREVGRAREDLMDEGMQPGYALDAEAFKRASEKLAPKAKPAAPAYSRESASALAGVPTGRPGPAGGRAEGDVKLNDAQEATWKAAGFKSREEYVKWQDPHKYGLVRQ